MMVIDNKFDIGDFVYLITDIQREKKIVTELVISKSSILYTLAYGGYNTEHYDFKITDDINVLIINDN
jgi:hypothetical protein